TANRSRSPNQVSRQWLEPVPGLAVHACHTGEHVRQVQVVVCDLLGPGFDGCPVGVGEPRVVGRALGERFGGGVAGIVHDSSSFRSSRVGVFPSSAQARTFASPVENLWVGVFLRVTAETSAGSVLGPRFGLVSHSLSAAATVSGGVPVLTSSEALMRSAVLTAAGCSRGMMRRTRSAPLVAASAPRPPP